MAVYKDKWNGYNGDTWRVACYYKDWQGKRVKHEKRGFATKKEAEYAASEGAGNYAVGTETLQMGGHDYPEANIIDWDIVKE